MLVGMNETMSLELACGFLIFLTLVDAISCLSCFQGELKDVIAGIKTTCTDPSICYEVRSKEGKTSHIAIQFGCGLIPDHYQNPDVLARIDYRTCTQELCNTDCSNEVKADLPNLLLCLHGQFQVGSVENIYYICHKNDKCARIFIKGPDGSIKDEYGSCAVECNLPNHQCAEVCEKNMCNLARASVPEDNTVIKFKVKSENAEQGDASGEKSVAHGVEVVVPGGPAWKAAKSGSRTTLQSWIVTGILAAVALMAR